MPTLSCNLSCRYCYLGSQTDPTTLKLDAGRAVATLQQALQRFLDADVLPFNVSLHGGEVTTLPPAVLEQLFSTINRHYLDHFDQLNAMGYRKSAPHLKTNLFNFHQLCDLFDQYQVSISASIDLPLSLHARYRVDRRGRSWLKRTVENLRLLGRYPHSKKISATLYHEHLQDIPALIDDIWKIHRDIGFDMNNFNIMFGFGSELNCQKFGGQPELGLQQASEAEQLALYHALQDAFMGTELEEGLRRNWFDEFKPSYCTNAFNCGERFYLLQGDGGVWSCVRGQGVEPLYYGNILSDGVEAVLTEGGRRVRLLHQQQGLDPGCQTCEYLQICHTGCPAVKLQNGFGKSYTCQLQQAIYRDNPASYPPLSGGDQAAAAREYLLGMHPALLQDELAQEQPKSPVVLIPAELYDQKNSLQALIAADPLLQHLYRPDAFLLELNGELIPLQSQILTSQRSLYSIGKDDHLVLHIRRSLFEANCSELIRNTLYIQLLRDTTVVYGDEQRSKQEHLITHQIFHNLLQPDLLLGEEWLTADLAGLLQLNSRYFVKNVLNNLFVTTGQLREYHYQKQKNNAFYHIQAINLPFQNFEFYWD
ncbi:MAG: SPASM domain-containing protein [Trichlorobacter sp.]|uniref:radical SAM protein n=1 Tax=Trichlorobacter sp. TaxID=2911007 RepID=UPI00256E4965|nr:SPASM domain-containing protein [Trichlorobacter sp.]